LSRRELAKSFGKSIPETKLQVAKSFGKSA